MLNLNKSLEEINEESMQKLINIGLSTSPSGIANLFLSIVNEEIAEIYNRLSVAHSQSFLSLATEEYLDRIGELLNCSRNENEDDGNYRFRISNQVLNMAKSNETSIRMAAMSIEGVQDVVMKPFTHGTGSFSVYVITQNSVTGNEILDSVREKINEVKGVGVRVEVYTPKTVPVEIKMKIIFKKEASDADKSNTIKIAESDIISKISSMTLGEVFDIREIMNNIYESNELVDSIDVYHYKFNNRKSNLISHQLKWNERCVVPDKIDAILIS